MIDPNTGLEVAEPPAAPPAAPPATPPATPPAAPPAAPAAAAPKTPGQMSEDEIKALEDQTGLSRKQLTAVTFIAAQQATVAPGVSRVVEKETFAAAKNAVLATGVTSIPAELEKKVEDVLAKLTPAERQNTKLVENIIWIERGKMNNPAPAAPKSSGTRVMTGIDDAPPASPAAGDEDFQKLSDEEKQYYTLGKFKDMKEYNSFKKRGIDTGYEQNWVPKFGPR